jgi:hypothetical protein
MQKATSEAYLLCNPSPQVNQVISKADKMNRPSHMCTHGCVISVTNPNNDKEVLMRYYYSKTYDEYIMDPNTHFFLCLEAYVEKTAKNAGLTSYAGKPLLLSVLHLKKSLREHLCRCTYLTWSLVHQQTRSSTLTDTLPGACPIAITTR